MAKTRTSPSFWALQGIAAFGVVLLAAFASASQLRARGVWPGIMLFALSLLAISTLLRVPYRAWWRPDRSWPALEGAAIAGSLAGALVAATGPFRWMTDYTPGDWTGWPLDVVECFVVLLLWSNVYFSLKQYLYAQAERERVILAESEAQAARLAALRHQLQPHFLFNALNGVSTLILEGESARANEMLTHVCNLLRASIEGSGATEVTLADEMNLVERYLSIEHTRLGHKLHFAREIPDNLMDALVPAMFLQPLVENAVRHGVAPSATGGRIRLMARKDRNVLHLTLENSVDSSDDAVRGHGIGLTNTRARLSALYGAQHTLAITCADRRFSVSASLPLRFATDGAP